MCDVRARLNELVAYQHARMAAAQTARLHRILRPFVLWPVVRRLVANWRVFVLCGLALAANRRSGLVLLTLRASSITKVMLLVICCILCMTSCVALVVQSVQVTALESVAR